MWLILGEGDMSSNLFHSIFHCPEDMDIISQYEGETFFNHILVGLKLGKMYKKHDFKI